MAARKQKIDPKRAALVRRLVTATGMSRHGVYKCLNEQRAPGNALALRGWNRVMAKAAR